MISDSISAVRQIVRLLLADHSPSQLAAGFTVGMIMGIMPKSNLIALSLCVVLFSLRCNKGLGLAAAVAFSFVAPWTDPFADRIGLAVLSVPSLQATYASILNAPLGTWLGFNNTVVAGTLLLGLYVAFPVFWFSRVFFSSVQAILGRKTVLPAERTIELKSRTAA